MKSVDKPIKRSALRLALGNSYYGILRKALWIKMNKTFAREIDLQPLQFSCFSHQTILRRKLKNVDMWMQENKIINLKIAAKKLNGIVLKPGQVFSYWKLIGKPSKREGYVDGMILKNGTFCAGTGGGLCQMSNLIFWMALHTPLTIVERHRHGYDVFPDSGRTQPFGSGATCYYPHGDLMIQNNTQNTYQLFVKVEQEYLQGQWRVNQKPDCYFKIVEKNHEMKGQLWGGYTRHNELYRQKLDFEDHVLSEELVVKNDAIMMYSPFLESKAKTNQK